MVQEEVVQLVWTHKVFRYLRNLPVLVGREQLRAYRGVDYV